MAGNTVECSDCNVKIDLDDLGGAPSEQSKYLLALEYSPLFLPLISSLLISTMDDFSYGMTVSSDQASVVLNQEDTFVDIKNEPVSPLFISCEEPIEHEAFDGETQVFIDQTNFVVKQEGTCENIKKEPMSPLFVSCEETVENGTLDGSSQGSDEMDETESPGLIKRNFYSLDCPEDFENAEENQETGLPHAKKEQEVEEREQEEEGSLSVDPLSLSGPPMHQGGTYPYIEAAVSGKESDDKLNKLLHMESSTLSHLQIPSSSSQFPLGDERGIGTQEHSQKTSFCSEDSTVSFENICYQTSFAMASSSTADNTIGQEEATGAYLSGSDKEEHVAGERQRGCYNQIGSGRGPSIEVNLPERNMQTCVSLKSSSGESMKVNLLDKHIRVHTSERTFKCNQCEKAFSQPGKLTRHMRIHKGERSFKCSQCDKSFYQNYALTEHMRIHSGEKPYRCSLCDKSFSKRGNLTVHMRIHIGEKHYKCSLCEKSFWERRNLSGHMLLHSGEKSFKCSQCEKSFYQEASLRRHMAVHKAERPITCIQCEKTFRSMGELTVHMRFHTSQRPYPCSQCEKSFHTSGNLNVHMRIHTGEKPHQCSQCGKSFSQSVDLSRHMHLHTGEKPYKCSLCEKSFCKSSDLTKHMRIHENS